MDVVKCEMVRSPYAPRQVQASRNLLQATLAMFGSQYRGKVGQVMQRFPEHVCQAEHLAAELEVLAESLFAANISYDLMLGHIGCSTAALATEEGPLLARNMDWFPEKELAQASCIVPTAHGWNAGFVGSVGVVTGMSDQGFALALNAALTGQTNPAGYPVLLFLRKILDEAQDFDAAVRMIAEEPLMSACMVTVVGARNDQRVTVERTPTRAAIRRPEGDEPLVVTNQFVLLSCPSSFCYRFECLSQLAGELSRHPTEEQLLAILTDDGVEQSITAQHIIAQPSSKGLKMWVPKRLVKNRPDLPVYQP